MTPDEAMALVLERYPRAKAFHGMDWQKGRVCILSGRGVFQLSEWCATEAEAWANAAARIHLIGGGVCNDDRT